MIRLRMRLQRMRHDQVVMGTAICKLCEFEQRWTGGGAKKKIPYASGLHTRVKGEERGGERELIEWLYSRLVTYRTLRRYA